MRVVTDYAANKLQPPERKAKKWDGREAIPPWVYSQKRRAAIS